MGSHKFKPENVYDQIEINSTWALLSWFWILSWPRQRQKILPGSGKLYPQLSEEKFPAPQNERRAVFGLQLRSDSLEGALEGVRRRNPTPCVPAWIRRKRSCIMTVTETKDRVLKFLSPPSTVCFQVSLKLSLKCNYYYHSIFPPVPGISLFLDKAVTDAHSKSVQLLN